MDNSYAISDSFWLSIKYLCPGKVGECGRTAKDNRLFVDAVVYVIRSGMPWRLLHSHCWCFSKRLFEWASAYRTKLRMLVEALQFCQPDPCRTVWTCSWRDDKHDWPVKSHSNISKLYFLEKWVDSFNHEIVGSG